MKTAFIITILILFAVQFAIRILRIFNERTEWPLSKPITLPQECGSAVLDGLFVLWAAFVLALS